MPKTAERENGTMRARYKVVNKDKKQITCVSGGFGTFPFQYVNMTLKHVHVDLGVLLIPTNIHKNKLPEKYIPLYMDEEYTQLIVTSHSSMIRPTDSEKKAKKNIRITLDGNPDWLTELTDWMKTVQLASYTDIAQKLFMKLQTDLERKMD
jgi:hypothetical protein